MRVLIAEDEQDIAKAYKIVLKERGHEITVAEDGEQCLQIYGDQLKKIKLATVNAHEHNKKNDDDDDDTSNSILSSSSLPLPFDAVVLDYRMPRKDGMEVAKEILELNPNQRIIFASAYVKETLEDSVKQLKKVVELLQKPFDPDILVDTIEDKEAFEGLKKLMVDIRKITRDKTNDDADLTHEQIKGLFESLQKIQKGRSFMYFFLSASTSIILSSMEPLA